MNREDIKLNPDGPIGVFDSGVGGISVLRELVKVMPEEDYLYFGDSANAPYGTKDLQTVRTLTIQNIEYLLQEGAKAIAVACNTATSAAVAQLRILYPQVPLVGIEPAIKPAAEQNPGKCIVVMATPMTLCQEKFQKLMSVYQDRIDIVPLPCPGLMEFIEKGDLFGEDLKSYLEKLFAEIKGKKPDGIVLGCTHYPFAKKMIREVVGEDVLIYDGGAGTARELKRRIVEADLSQKRQQLGTVTFLNSKKTDEEIALSEKLFHSPEQ